MAVGSHRQAVAAAQAAAFQHLPSISGCHPRTEAMHANTAANFGLVCPFGHIIFLSSLVLATVSCANCQTDFDMLGDFRSAQVIAECRSKLYSMLEQRSNPIPSPAIPNLVRRKHFGQLPGTFRICHSQNLVTRFKSGDAARHNHLTMADDGRNNAVFG